MKKAIVLLIFAVVLSCTACSSNEIILDEDPVIDPTPTPEVTNDPQLVKIVESLFAQQLDFVVPDDQADASAKVSNAMLKATKVTVHSALDDKCEVTVRYPDVATLLIESIDLLPDQADEIQRNEFYTGLASKIENEQVIILEESFTVDLMDYEDGSVQIVMTDKLMNALTGGLYLAQEEGE